MREQFNRLDKNTNLLIEVDFDAYGYKNKYDWLFSIFIKFDASNENQENYEEFLETKESIIILLEHDNKAKYAGMRVVDGWSELYFYTNTSKGFDTLIANALKGSRYAYESNIVRDAKWNVYEVQLTPTELELCHITSAKIIAELEEEGDNLDLVREVEHYISFDTATQKERFIDNAVACGFEYKDDISTEEYEHGVALLKAHAVTLQIVASIVSELFAIIKKDHGFYEGWSTTLATEQEDM